MLEAPILERIDVERHHDDSPDLSWLKQDYFADHYTGEEAYLNVTQEENEKYKAQDAERLRAYYNDEWSMLWLKVVGYVSANVNGESFSTTLFDTLGGIEDDAPDYIAENERDMINGIIYEAHHKKFRISAFLEINIHEDVKYD
jgi:hypothetical protein